MLTSWNTLLRAAQERGYALGAFNTYNLEITQAIVRAAQATSAPAIIATGSGALKYAGTEALASIAILHARATGTPVAVHLDHCTKIEEITDCLRLGYTGVMIDGSALSFGENIDLTRHAVEAARAHDASIEAELGGIIGEEDRAGTHAANTLTDPAQAEEFVRATGIDALAVAVGNVHGFYRGEPRLDFARLREIRARVDVPLVLHGASGLSPNVIRQAIELGVCKFNVNTEIRVALFNALRAHLDGGSGDYDVPKLFGSAVTAMQRVIEDKIELFAHGQILTP